MPTIQQTKTYAVVGATSDVGKVVVQGLKVAGHRVRPISRSFNQQERWALELRSPRNSSPTTLEQWAQAALAQGEPA